MAAIPNISDLEETYLLRNKLAPVPMKINRQILGHHNMNMGSV